MKKQILLLVLLAAGISLFSQKQKVTVDGDTIKADGKAIALIEKKGGLSVDMKVKSLAGKLLINFSFQEYNDPDKANSGNPKGRVTYYEITFMGIDNMKCEDNIPSTKKGIAKFVVSNELIVNDALEPEAVKNTVNSLGTKFSDDKKALQGPKVIIIEK